MKKLLIIDEKDYTDEMPIFQKYAVRAIIKKGNKLAMQCSKEGDYKIPGGTVERGESYQEALIREVQEETGLTVIPKSIAEIGEIEEVREDKKYKGQKYICHSLYYTCEVLSKVGPTNMTDSEKRRGYKLEWATLDEIYNHNKAIVSQQPWIKRDTDFIKLIIDKKVSV